MVYSTNSTNLFYIENEKGLLFVVCWIKIFIN